jgi:hypothetical protein
MIEAIWATMVATTTANTPEGVVEPDAASGLKFTDPMELERPAKQPALYAPYASDPIGIR